MHSDMIDVDDNNTIVVAGGIVGTVLITLLIVIILMIIILWCYSKPHKGKGKLGSYNSSYVIVTSQYRSRISLLLHESKEKPRKTVNIL